MTQHHPPVPGQRVWAWYDDMWQEAYVVKPGAWWYDLLLRGNDHTIAFHRTKVRLNKPKDFRCVQARQLELPLHEARGHG